MELLTCQEIENNFVKKLKVKCIKVYTINLYNKPFWCTGASSNELWQDNSVYILSARGGTHKTPYMGKQLKNEQTSWTRRKNTYQLVLRKENFAGISKFLGVCNIFLPQEFNLIFIKTQFCYRDNPQSIWQLCDITKNRWPWPLSRDCIAE